MTNWRSAFTLTDEEKVMAQEPYPGRINAIKSIRERTHLGLRDAKDLLDSLAPLAVDIDHSQLSPMNYVDALRDERDRYRAALEAITRTPYPCRRLAQDALDGKK